MIRFVGLNQPMAYTQAESLAEYKGRIDQIWSHIQTVATKINSPAVAAAVEGAAHGHLDRAGEAYTTWVHPHRGQVRQLKPDEFLLAIRTMQDTILPIRDAALAEALRKSRSESATIQVRFKFPCASCC